MLKNYQCFCMKAKKQCYCFCIIICSRYIIRHSVSSAQEQLYIPNHIIRASAWEQLYVPDILSMLLHESNMYCHNVIASSWKQLYILTLSMLLHEIVKCSETVNASAWNSYMFWHCQYFCMKQLYVSDTMSMLLHETVICSRHNVSASAWNSYMFQTQCQCFYRREIICICGTLFAILLRSHTLWQHGKDPGPWIILL